MTRQCSVRGCHNPRSERFSPYSHLCYHHWFELAAGLPESEEKNGRTMHMPRPFLSLPTSRAESLARLEDEVKTHRAIADHITKSGDDYGSSEPELLMRIRLHRRAARACENKLRDLRIKWSTS
jgi:hypothetical protein